MTILMGTARHYAAPFVIIRTRDPLWFGKRAFQCGTPMNHTEMATSTRGKQIRRLERKIDPESRRIALRTAFVARFIVLREGRRSRAHRLIEEMKWTPESCAEDLYRMFRQAFLDNGDKLQPVDRDLKRALGHAERSVDYFIGQYIDRATLSFAEALEDYERSNQLLFGDEVREGPRNGGWRLPSENSARTKR